MIEIELVDLIVMSAGVATMARILAYESIADPVREFLGVRYNDGRAYAESFFGKAILCPICSSVWLAFFVAAIYLMYSDLAVVITLPFAMSGLASTSMLDS